MSDSLLQNGKGTCASSSLNTNRTTFWSIVVRPVTSLLSDHLIASIVLSKFTTLLSSFLRDAFIDGGTSHLFNLRVPQASKPLDRKSVNSAGEI